MLSLEKKIKILEKRIKKVEESLPFKQRVQTLKERKNLFNKAIKLVRERDRASASLLQRGQIINP